VEKPINAKQVKQVKLLPSWVPQAATQNFDDIARKSFLSGGNSCYTSVACAALKVAHM
jgi:hypothetical protein